MKIYSIITKIVVCCILHRQSIQYIQVKNVTRLVYCHLLIDYLWKRSNVSSEGPSLKRKHDNSDKGPSLETLDLNLVTFLTSIIMVFLWLCHFRKGVRTKIMTPGPSWLSTALWFANFCFRKNGSPRPTQASDCPLTYWKSNGQAC